ncbi:MAG: hypothetical protein Q7L55_05880 [Actinomycetota bacterium]|nr:hypothetical protein [Actinomycetota bacterium]
MGTGFLRLVVRGLSVGVALLLLLQISSLASGASASTPEWDVSGTWSSAGGDLVISQSADGSLTGRFIMKRGCTDTYGATGRIDGSSISLSLARASGRGDEYPCAGTQTLNGSVGPRGTTLILTLVNFAQTSPASPFTGQATSLRADETFKQSFSVLVSCGTTGSQICPKVFVGVVRPGSGRIAVLFTLAQHCSDVRLYISVDGGVERVSPFLGSRQATRDYSFRIGDGPHRVQVRAEGRRGGCNYGQLSIWGGTLLARSLA